MTDNIKAHPLLHDIPFNQKDKNLIVQLSLKGITTPIHYDKSFGLVLSIKDNNHMSMSLQFPIDQVTNGNLAASILKVCKNANNQLSQMNNPKYLDDLITNTARFHFVKQYAPAYFNDKIKPLLNHHIAPGKVDSKKINNTINQYEVLTNQKLNINKPEFQTKLNQIRKSKRLSIHFQHNLIQIVKSLPSEL